MVTQEQLDKVRAIAERTWRDMAGLPWKDKAWTGSEVAMEQSHTHYVEAITNDIAAIFADENDNEEEE